MGKYPPPYYRWYLGHFGDFEIATGAPKKGNLEGVSWDLHVKPMRFNYITITTMVVFGVEVIINTLGKQGYLFGFFFFLDVLSTVTLVLDLTYAA